MHNFVAAPLDGGQLYRYEEGLNRITGRAFDWITSFKTSRDAFNISRRYSPRVCIDLSMKLDLN